LQTLASLFYGCFDHCLQVTEHDIHQIVDAIEVLADPKFTVSNQSSNKSSKNLLFVIDLCTLLIPILLNGPVPISLALTNETRLLIVIPTTIAVLLRSDSCDMNKIDIALRFYSQLIQSRAKYDDTNVSHSDDEQDIEKPSAITTEPVTQPMNSLCLTKNLLSSYYTLHRQFQMLIRCDETAIQQEQLQALYETEWKKIDTLQLKHDYEQLKEKNQRLDEDLTHLSEELQRTQSARDQYLTEKIQVAQEIDRLKLATPTNVIIKTNRVPASVSTEKDITDQTDIINQLKTVLPHQITTEQAEQFIREIYRRRTTFQDEDMRKSICGSLKHLGSDLYSSSVHFLHELIQVNVTCPQTLIQLSIIECRR
jgi:hypothetical protein